MDKDITPVRKTSNNNIKYGPMLVSRSLEMEL